jgi:hypothetical protein
MERVIVYIASPDWELNIYASIHSLVQSGTSFDLIKVFSVGGEMNSIRKIDTKIEVENVKNVSKEYFLNNKTYLVNQDGSEVVYLDSDTIVLGDIGKISKSYRQNIIARVDSCPRTWNYVREMNSGSIKKWKSILDENQIRSKMYNSGFVIFKNNSNKKISESWKRLAEKDREIWESEKEKLKMERRITDQMTFSFSVENKFEEVGEMKSFHHVYGWNKGPKKIPKNTVVYHTGSRGGRHLKYASAVAEERSVSFRTPTISGPTHPLFLRLQAYDIGYRVKHFFVGAEN